MQRSLLATAALALVLTACRPSPERLMSQAHTLADQQDWPALLAHLDTHDLSGPDVDVMRFSALVGTAAWSEAYAMIAALPAPDEAAAETPPAGGSETEASASQDARPPALDPAGVVLVCAHHAAETDAAPEVVATCAAQVPEGATATLLAELGALGSTDYDPHRADQRFAPVRDAADPGVELLAPLVEARLDALAEAAETPLASDPYRQAAFQVRRPAERGEALIAWYQTQIDANAESDPQTAVSWSERLYQPQVAGLSVPEELSASAQVRVREFLFPTFLDYFHARYLRKHADDDLETGRWDPETETFRFDPSETRDVDAAAWAYLTLERPQPSPSPDFLGDVEACADTSQPCVIPFETVARWGYEMGELEDALAQATGQPLTWPTPM